MMINCGRWSLLCLSWFIFFMTSKFFLWACFFGLRTSHCYHCKTKQQFDFCLDKSYLDGPSDSNVISLNRSNRHLSKTTKPIITKNELFNPDIQTKFVLKVFKNVHYTVSYAPGVLEPLGIGQFFLESHVI